VTARRVRRNGHNKPIISIDIDGTLADYHGWFLRFATDYFGREFPAPGEINPGLKLWRFMGISKPQYEDCKLAYRQGGMKRSMPCLPGAAAVSQKIRSMGCEVWICTTRPFMRLDNIDPDTQEWLRRNSIEYDALLYDPRSGDEKYRELARQAIDRAVLGCAEDLPEQVSRIIRYLGVPIWLRNQPYNQTSPIKPSAISAAHSTMSISRWDTADELLAMASNAITLWEAAK